jgi:hypothetical protein
MGYQLHRSVLAALCAVALSPLAARADFYWVGGSGAWDNAANWSDSPGGAGGLGVPAAFDWAFLQFDDAVNRTVLGTPANTTFSFNRFETSSTGAGTLTLNITQGTFGGGNAQLLGRYGETAVVQTGGANIAGGLEMASDGTAHSSYDLYDGLLTAGGIGIGPYGGQGLVRQHGGTAQFTSIVVGANSRYELSGGTLNSGYYEGSGYGLQVVAGGTFIQTAGSYTARDIAVDGRYEWNGGTLNVTESLRINGDFVFPTTPVTLNIDGIVDLSGASVNLVNAANVALNLTSTSLVLRSATFNPAAAFGTFTNPGFTHVMGNTLAVFPGRTLKLAGDFNDPVDCFGTITVLSDRYFSLHNALTLRSGGYIDMSFGNLEVKNWTTQILGGKLVAQSMTVGNLFFNSFPPSPPSVAVQSGGEVRLDSLDTASGAGTYVLNGGSITTRLTSIGKNNFFHFFNSSGTMIQNGGTHTASQALMLGTGTGSSGTYILNGGTLLAGDLNVSAPGSGGFGFPPPPPTYGDGRLEINSSSAHVSLTGGLAFGPYASFAAVPGTTIRFTGAAYFGNMSTDPAALSGLENTTLLFDIGSTDLSPFEASGQDLGPILDGFTNNFVLDTLEVGGAFFSGLGLTDQFDNQPGSDLPDAVYVKTLIVGPGSYLDLGGLNLYCLNLINSGTILSSGGGQLTVVPEPGALLCLAGWALLAARRRRR